MAWTPESVFENESDYIHAAKELIKEYEFSLKELSTPIKIRLYKFIGSQKVMFTQSHFINTSVQAGPYDTSRPWNDDLGSALHQVVSGITEYYKAAITNGHTPDETWLEVNKDF